MKKLVTRGGHKKKGETFWRAEGKMSQPRAFFCLVDLMDSHFLAIGQWPASPCMCEEVWCVAGGYSSGQQIVNSTEVFTVTTNWTQAWSRPPASRWPPQLHTVLADMK